MLARARLVANASRGEMSETNSKAMEHPLHVVTPLLRSHTLSEKCGASVWLKMESVQNSGSFKVRGLGHLAQKSVRNGCSRFVSSSGGNAGLAAAFCARELGLPITVVVPQTTPGVVVERLKEEGATVEVVGKVWDEANVRALELAASPGTVLLHPFDHPDIWEGHSSLVDELQQQLRGIVPDVIVVSVGGGGLMNGVLEGMHRIGWEKVPVVAMETEGADSLAACIREGQWTELDDITSIARCLGAKRVSKRAFEWLSQHNVISQVITDRAAVSACINIADDHRMLVAPACGAALAAVYGATLSGLQRAGSLPPRLNNVVVVVCGGSGVSLDILQDWRTTFDL